MHLAFRLNEILEFAEDMVIDIPKIWTYLAQMVAPMVIGGSLSMQKLVEILKTALADSTAKLLAPCILQIKEKLVCI